MKVSHVIFCCDVTDICDFLITKFEQSIVFRIRVVCSQPITQNHQMETNCSNRSATLSFHHDVCFQGSKLNKVLFFTNPVLLNKNYTHSKDCFYLKLYHNLK